MNEELMLIGWSVGDMHDEAREMSLFQCATADPKRLGADGWTVSRVGSLGDVKD
jgi:hypothetical protein